MSKENKMTEYTRIPNSFIDDLKLNPYQFQILSIIVRKTDGWCKLEDGISLSQFEKLVSFKKNKIVNTIKELCELELIEKTKHYNNDTKTYSYSTYKIHSRVVSENNKGSISQKQGVVSEKDKQKKAITKETKTKPFDTFITYLKEKATIKSKVTKTKEGEKLFKEIEDKKQLVLDYLEHQREKKEFAVRITSFMEDYQTVYKQQGKENHPIFGEYGE